MNTRAWLPALAAISLTVTAACGSNPKPQAPAMPQAAPKPPAAMPAPQPPVDPIASLIKASQAHFESGERELKIGHLEQARSEFDRAVNVLLESPYGARADARLREHFDRLIDRISAYEVLALAQGDGFVEKKYEPASIDELLKIATIPEPPADAVHDGGRQGRPGHEPARHSHSAERARPVVRRELFQGRLRDYINESLTRGTRYLPMIQNVFRAEGLPLDLAYIPIIESGFKTNALSKANAKGPWQFMKATASRERPEARLVHRRAVGSRRRPRSRPPST